MNRILLVDDAKDIQLIVSRSLIDESTSVIIASNASEALEKIKAGNIDLVLLDISLPDGNGFDLCVQFQNDESTKHIPIVFLTGSEAPSSVMTAYSLGADDFIHKPMNPAELKIIVNSKIKKSKRNSVNSDESIIEPFRFHLGSQRVWTVADQIQIDLTPREFKLFYFLAKNQPNIFSRAQILDEVWGSNANVVDRTVDTHIYMLRKKLNLNSKHIESVAGVGYRFVPLKELRKNAA